MKIIIDKAIPYISGRIAEEVEVIYIPGNEITDDIVKDADAIVVRTRTKCNEALLGDSKVKLVVTATIGTDHIDTEWCSARGIKVVNAPGCNAPGVAQYVLASLFKMGFHPGKHTLGIIGYGHVGKVVADWAKKMGIKILVNDPPRQIKGETDADYRSLEEVLRNSDAVTLHIPLLHDTPFPTYKLIGKEEMDLMKHGAFLVNSSRGGVVDEKALKEKISEGKIKAIIDVWENEPEIDAVLAEVALIKTPHIAGYSEEGKRRATLMALKALNKEFGIKIDTTGLIQSPTDDVEITKELIEKSYNPLVDSENLSRDISRFENLRNNYCYRHEPLYSL